ncbi:Uncharacterised protein [Mycobacteroides abscessus]|nr:Uncharacterised protein [Mycobacteroides abscessus]
MPTSQCVDSAPNELARMPRGAGAPEPSRASASAAVARRTRTAAPASDMV